MNIEGYEYISDMTEEDFFLLALHFLELEIIVGNDEIWSIMTGQEENTDGRQETTDQDTNSR